MVQTPAQQRAWLRCYFSSKSPKALKTTDSDELENPVHPDAHIKYHFAKGHYAENDCPLKDNIPILPDTVMMCLAAILKPIGAVDRAIDSEGIVPGQFVIFDHRTQFTDIFQATLGIAIKTCGERVASHRLV